MKGYLKKGIACFIFLFSISMSLSFVSALERNDEVKMNDVVEVKNGLYKENGKVYFYENDSIFYLNNRHPCSLNMYCICDFCWLLIGEDDEIYGVKVKL